MALVDAGVVHCPLNYPLLGVSQATRRELSGPAEQLDHGPAPAPAGQGGVVVGVPAETSSQHQHEASHPQPLLGPVLPTRCHLRRPEHHSLPHICAGQACTLLLLREQK